MPRKMFHTPRASAPVSYAESDGSAISPYRTPDTSRPNFVDLTDDDEDDKDERETDTIQVSDQTLNARGLRTRQLLNLSLKASENGDKPNKRKATTIKLPRRTNEPHDYALSPLVSDRLAVRQEIANVTAAKRNRFFVENKDYFLPLLPDSNFIKKLVEKHNALGPNEKAKVPAILPYEEIETQPIGVKAKMKPYQLSGLSFMVYLHRNGLSGILGDEMGLGKTLQTLSLIQYLKENEPKGDRQLRPFLVVCPLSVLSSWMAEAKKWTPGLKVLRFHGPVKERDRLKKIAVGEIDMMGNMTVKQKTKINIRRTAAGKDLISLDSDDEDAGPELGVDLIVTTYDSFKAEQGWFKRAFVWRYAILDEGHTIKNDLSLVSIALQGLQAEYRLILTGTPLQNNLAELWALLHWLYQDVFTDQTAERFRDSFNLSKGQYNNTFLDSSRHLLELIMLRRMKNSAGVDLNLPPKTEVLLFVPLSPMQRFWYTRMITRADKGLLEELYHGAKSKEEASLEQPGDAEARMIKREAEALDSLSKDMVVGSDEWKESRDIIKRTIERENTTLAGAQETQSSAWRKLMNLLMQLRKICNHPYQIPNSEPEPYETGDHIIRASGKFIVLDKLITELVVKQRKKILIFSGFTRMLDLVEEFLSIRGGDGSEYRHVRLDGSTGRARRNLGIRMFNDVNSEYRVMLISTRAGGLGINLATASDVVLLDQDWNPQITLQAEARAHRIGQTKPVTIYKLVSQGTVEEQMMGRIQKKLYLSAKVTESMQDIHTKAGAGKMKKGPGGRLVAAEDDMPQLSTGQLMSLVRRGTSALSRPETDINEMLTWDWETTVAKCKDQPADINVKKDAIPNAVVDAEAEQRWLTEMERVESTIFEGKKLARENGTGKATSTTADIAGEWNRADRRVGKNTTVMVDGFAISKESMNCKDWEAVPTMAGRDPRLAEPKRAKKAAIIAQSHCQVCLDGGEMYCCQLCPRSYHFECLEPEFKAKAKGWQFNCPQHQCADCEQKTTDAGGMLFRCRWCERAYCEDCLNWEKTKLLGSNLLEYEILGYQEIPQAFYIECHTCVDNHEENPQNKVLCDGLAAEISKEHDRVFGAAANVTDDRHDSRAGSLSDGTTIETPGIKTPMTIDEDTGVITSRKRKAAEASIYGNGKGKEKKNGSLRISFKRGGRA